METVSVSLRCPPSCCSTCPLSRSTPPGIWHPSEYRKLPLYDDQKPEFAVFHCHQENATGVPTVCRGWLAVFGYDALAVRIAVSRGEIPPQEVERPCAVPLYGSGAEACAAGLAGVKKPSTPARKAIERLVAKGVGEDQDFEVSAFVRALRAADE